MVLKEPLLKDIRQGYLLTRTNNMKHNHLRMEGLLRPFDIDERLLASFGIPVQGEFTVENRDKLYACLVEQQWKDIEC